MPWWLFSAASTYHRQVHQRLLRQDQDCRRRKGEDGDDHRPHGCHHHTQIQKWGWFGADQAIGTMGTAALTITVAKTKAAAADITTRDRFSKRNIIFSPFVASVGPSNRRCQSLCRERAKLKIWRYSGVIHHELVAPQQITPYFLARVTIIWENFLTERALAHF
ncbi:MAG: hypothetical protein K2X59_11895 [Sphingomonas sp.]|nr:hypothetical protein [Sphingomonas sp.]